MVIQFISKGPITKRDRWFPDQPGFSLWNTYYQCDRQRWVPGMKCLQFHTLHIDLTKSPEDIEAGFDKGTRYEIRRAVRAGISFTSEVSPNLFIDFFNQFAYKINLEPTSENYFNFDPAPVVTAAKLDDQILVMHAYIADNLRTRLYMSASTAPFIEDKSERALVGFANRFLHGQDMLHFKNQGTTIYDFGGYAKDTHDPKLKGINKFKAGFGGEIVEEYNYQPILL